MDMPPFFQAPPQLTPEQEKQVEALSKATADQQIAWRRLQVSQWGFLFCTCKRSQMFTYAPGEQYTAGCPVHGGFLLSYTGELL